jgi:hypothetical protein
LREFRVIPDALADVEPIRIGQHDVEKDEIGANTAAQFDRAPSRLRTREIEPFFFEVVLKKGIKIRVVFDDYNSFTHGDFSLREPRYRPVNAG